MGGLQVLWLLIFWALSALGPLRVGNQTWYVTMFAGAALNVLHEQLQDIFSALASVSCLAVLPQSSEAGLRALTRQFSNRADVIDSLHIRALSVVLPFSPRQYRPPMFGGDCAWPARLQTGGQHA